MSRKKRLLFLSGEGLGNCVQTLPCIRTIKEKLDFDFIDYLHVYGTYRIPKVIPYVDEWYFGNQIQNVDFSRYDGFVATVWAKNLVGQGPFARLKLLNEIRNLSMDESEVGTYMHIARDLGVKEEDILWHGNCSYNKIEDKYDVVIHNGYNRFGSARWEIKSYPYYEKVVENLMGLKVCSVGAKEEYVKGTENRTGMDLLDTLGLIKNARLFIGNDSALYHFSNALETDNIVIFTATSTTKNYCEKFHKYSTIITRDDLECRPCQKTRRWQKDCKDWKCRDISPETVLHGIKQVITARFMSEASEVYEDDRNKNL